MAEEPKQKPFYERPWFAGTVALVGLVGAVWVLSARVVDTADDIAANSQETVYSYTQIILDTSEGMGEPFGDGTKLDAGVEAVERYVMPLEGEGLALRRTGRTCDEHPEQLVEFGTGHADDVVDEARGQYAEGRSALASAVIETITDFVASGDFRESASARRIVIITGGVGDEECLLGEGADEIRRRLEDTGIDATFKLVALSPTPSANERLDSFEAVLGEEVEFAVVETPEELAEAVAEDTAEISAEIEELAALAGESSELDETGEGELEEGEAEDGEPGGDEGGPDADEGGPGETDEEGGPETGPGSPGSTETELGATEEGGFAP